MYMRTHAKSVQRYKKLLTYANFWPILTTFLPFFLCNCKKYCNFAAAFIHLITKTYNRL